MVCIVVRDGKRALHVGDDGLSLGQRLRKLRLDRKLSVAELAAAASMTSGAIDKLENDGSNEPSFSNGLRISAALKIPTWILAGQRVPPLSDVLTEKTLPFAARGQLLTVKLAVEHVDGLLRELLLP